MVNKSGQDGVVDIQDGVQLGHSSGVSGLVHMQTLGMRFGWAL